MMGRMSKYMKDKMLLSLSELRAAKLIVEVLRINEPSAYGIHGSVDVTVALFDKDDNKLVDIHEQRLVPGSKLTVLELDQLFNLSLGDPPNEPERSWATPRKAQ